MATRHRRGLAAATSAIILAVSTAASAQQAYQPPAPRRELAYAAQPAAPRSYASYSAFGYSPQASYPPRVAPNAEKDDKTAKEKPDNQTAHFDVSVATEVPLMVGGQATLELPYGFLLQGELGTLPRGYVNAVDGILTGAGAYDAATSQVVRDGISGSLVFQGSAGIRPFEGHGFEMLGGYTLLSFGGGTSARQAIESATGATLPAEIPDAQIGIRSTIHGFHASLGWRWVVEDHLVLRASLGYMQAVASTSRLEVPASVAANPEVSSRVAEANRLVGSTLDNAYTTYIKMPVIGMSLGYRF